MKLLFSNEWSRKKIAADTDTDIAAGEAFEQLLARMDQIDERSETRAAALPDRNVVQLRVALGTLLRGLRLQRLLSIEELSIKADVPEDELRRVEHDPHYTAHPRLIRQLSQYFEVPLSRLSQLSGSTGVVDRALYNEAVRYAARADDLSTVTPAEQELLDAFVALLNENARSDHRG